VGIDLDMVDGLAGRGRTVPMVLVHTWLSSLPCGTLAAGLLPATG